MKKKVFLILSAFLFILYFFNIKKDTAINSKEDYVEIKKTSIKNTKKEIVKEKNNKQKNILQENKNDFIKKWKDEDVTNDLNSFDPKTTVSRDVFEMGEDNYKEWIAREAALKEEKLKKAIEKMKIDKIKHGHFDLNNNDMGTTPHAGIGILRDYKLDKDGNLIKINRDKN